MRKDSAETSAMVVSHFSGKVFAMNNILKFLPSLGILMPPVAGAFKLKFRRFLAPDTPGSLLYAGCFITSSWNDGFRRLNEKM